MMLRSRSVARLLAVFSFAIAILVAASWCQHCQAAPPNAAEKPARRAPGERSAKSKPFAPEKLLRAFQGNRENARQKALDDAERWFLADSRLPATLWQVIEPALKQPEVAESSVRAARIYAGLDDRETTDGLKALLEAADSRLVLVALDALARHHPAGILERLTGLDRHPAYKASYGFRHAVVSAVAALDEPTSVAFLISTVSRSDGQLKYEAARHLARLTGQNFGGKSADWKRWWDGNAPQFRVTRAADRPPVTAPGAPLPWDYDVPQFYGTPIYAKRVLFVIDKSKSMLSSVDGVTRLDGAEKELEGAIRKLPDDAWFDIIAYNDFEQPYQGKLVPATPLEKSGAAQFIYSLVAERQTDIYDTLADALRADSNLEAILFLSDGAPTVGTIVDQPTIIKSITQQNVPLRVSINTIGIDARGANEEFLKKLAEDNFGEYRSIR